MNLGQNGEGMVRLLGHVHLLVVAKQPVHKPRKFLLPCKSQRQQCRTRGLDFRAWQAKGAAGVLVFGQPVPPATQQRLEQLLGLHLGGKLGQFAAPGLRDLLDGGHLHARAGDGAEKPHAQHVYRGGASVAGQQRLYLLIRDTGGRGVVGRWHDRRAWQG